MADRTRLRFLLPFTRAVIVPLTRPLARWLPGFGILEYRGRTSGRLYRTPMNVFHRGDRYVFALTYGPDVQWVKNIVAAGGCELVTTGRRIRLVEPRLVHDPARTLMPAPVRFFLGLMAVTEFLTMRIVRD